MKIYGPIPMMVHKSTKSRNTEISSCYCGWNRVSQDLKSARKTGVVDEWFKVLVPVHWPLMV